MCSPIEPRGWRGGAEYGVTKGMVDLTRVTNKLIRKSIFIRITYGHHCLSAPFERLPDSDPYYCNPSMKVLPETTRKEHTHTRQTMSHSRSMYSWFAMPYTITPLRYWGAKYLIFATTRRYLSHPGVLRHRNTNNILRENTKKIVPCHVTNTRHAARVAFEYYRHPFCLRHALLKMPVWWEANRHARWIGNIGRAQKNATTWWRWVLCGANVLAGGTLRRIISN